MTFVLNDEQAVAIAFEGNTWVSAGAGSGKTRTLVELYIKLLEEAVDDENAAGAERTVAITFTEKAAGEMRERVRHALDERLAAAETIHEKERWATLRRELPRAPIGTIHSFCSRLLRENPAAARVDPAFVVLEERESTALLERAVERVVVGGVQRGNEAARTLVETFGLQRSGLHGTEGVREAVSSLYLAMVGAGVSVAQCRLKVTPPAGLLSPLLDRLVRCLNVAFDSGRSEAFEVSQRFEALQTDIAAATLDDPVGGLRLVARLRELMKGKRSLQTLDAWKDAKECVDDMGRLLADALSVPLIHCALDLIDDIERDYQAAKDRLSGLDFDDLQLRARNLLRDFPAIRARYQDAFRVLMLDEFQDTNDLQDEIVRLLAERVSPDAAGDLEPRKLFVVGDPKQSIYGFRGADVSVFSRMKDSMETACWLQSNYRSVPAVVDFVNEFFEHTVLAGESASSWEVRFSPHDRMRASRSGSGSVSVLALEREPDDLIEDVQCKEAELIADMIADMVAGPRPWLVGEEQRGARFGDCALLFRVSSRMKLYAHELQRRGIPYYIVKGQGFFECQEIKDVLNVLLYLDDADDTIALAGFLRSPMVGLSDDAMLRLATRKFFKLREPKESSEREDRFACEGLPAAEREAFELALRWLREWRELRHRLAPSELLERIVRSTGYLSSIVGLFQGQQKVANVRKLVDMARSYEEAGPYHFRGFVRYLQTLIDEGAREPEYPVWAEKADVVRLMTVHQSKGLEFPIVFVPQMARENRAPAQTIMFHPQQGVVVKVRPDRYHDWIRPAAFSAVEEEQKRRGDEEHRRLLYVALTRAADHLIMSGEFGDREARKGTWARWLRDHVGGELLDGKLPGEGGPVRVWRRADVPRLDGQVQLDGPPPAPLPDLEPIVKRVCGFQTPAPRQLSVTARELAEYSVCARRQYYLGLLGLEEFPPRPRDARDLAESDDGSGGAAVGAGWSALQKGTLVHRVLQRVSLDASADEVEQLTRRLVPSWRAHEPAALQLIGEVRDDVTALLAGDTGTLLRGASVLDREVPLQLGLRGPDGWSLLVEGVADAILRDAHDEWWVIDYKGARAERSRAAFYHYQLSIYALALAERFSLERVTIGVQYLRERGPLRSTVLEADELQRLRVDLLARGRELAGGLRRLDEGGWPKVEPAQVCHDMGCGFRWRCGRAGEGPADGPVSAGLAQPAPASTQLKLFD
jgi:ATP-dependent helicase/nuclease subunit A